MTYQLNDRRQCRQCGKALVYTTGGWMHVRATRMHHRPEPLEETPPIDMESALHAQITALQEIIAVKDARIATLLEANRELSQKVHR